MAHENDESPRQRALRSIKAMSDGANVPDEAFQLSNEFTDRHTARFTAWVKKRLRRRG